MRTVKCACAEDVGFLRFWENYPKRKAKAEALKAWMQLHPSQELVDTMIWALGWQRRQLDWLKDSGQYIPLPASWIRGRRWEDEQVQLPQVNEKTARTLASGAAFVSGDK